MQVVVVKTKWLEQSHSNLSLKADKIIVFPRTLSNKVLCFIFHSFCIQNEFKKEDKLKAIIYVYFLEFKSLIPGIK